MGTDLRIYQQEFKQDNKGRNQIILTEIATTYQTELIEELRDVGLRSWYVDSECGCIFELQGMQLFPYADKLHLDINEIYAEDFYRLSVSY